MKQINRNCEAGIGVDDADCTVLPAWGVILLVAGCLLLCFKLIPSKTETAMRLAADGQLSRAAAMIRPETQAVNNSTRLSDAEARQLFVTMLAETNPGGRDTDKLSRLMLCVNDLGWIREQITANAPDISEDNFTSLMENMGDVAMSRQDLSAAADAYHTVNLKSSTTQRIEKEISAWRAKGDPKQALLTLEEYLKSRPLIAENTNLQTLQITLLRETGQSGRAFDIVTKSLPTPFEEAQLSLLERLAEESDRTSDVTTYQQKWLEATVGPDLSNSQLKASGETIRHAFLMGRYLEWSSQPDKAFTVFEQLAKIGSEAATERCIDLYDSLNYDTRMEELLSSLPTSALRKDWLATRAQLRCGLGHLEEALEDFNLILKNDPENVTALSQMAALLLSNEEFEKALPLLEHSHQLDQTNTKITHALADTLISLDRPNDALPLYQELADNLEDSDALERYELLAESLELPDLLTDALQRQVSVTNGQAPDLQLRLAAARQCLPQGRNAATATLRAALAVIPESRPIRLELSEMLLDQGQTAEVIPLLATSDMATNAKAIEQLLDAGAEGAPMHLLAGFFTENQASQSTPLTLAYEDLRASVIHGHLPDSISDESTNTSDSQPSEALRDAAEKAYQNRQFTKALAHMKEFLSAATEPTPGDLNLLGHIYRELGDMAHSREAFHASMRSASARTTSLRNASASTR